MTAKWGKDWRKLYRRPSRQWLNLPVGVRGLGDELIRVAEDDGRIYVGADALRGVMHAVEAHAREWQWVKVGFERLLADGFCRVEGEHVLIRNFVEAQTAVTPSGQRMRAKRERDQAEGKPGPNGGQATPKRPPSDPQATPEDQQVSETTAGKTVTVTVEEKEKRREEKRTNPRRGPPPSEQLDLGPPSPDGVPPPPTPTVDDRLPLKAGEPLRVLAATSDGRIKPVEARDVSRGQAIALIAAIKRYPLRAEWERLGRWLAAGGLAYRADLGASWAASAALGDAMAAARAWDGASLVGPALAVVRGSGAPEPMAPGVAPAVRRQREFKRTAVTGPGAADRLAQLREAALGGTTRAG
jgi:hypothetical protein